MDAALDLSHTQNIGRMIKTHFPHSQVNFFPISHGLRVVLYLIFSNIIYPSVCSNSCEKEKFCFYFPTSRNFVLSCTMEWGEMDLVADQN